METGYWKSKSKQLVATIGVGLITGVLLAAPKAVEVYQATHPAETTVIDNTGGPLAARMLTTPAKRFSHHKHSAHV